MPDAATIREKELAQKARVSQLIVAAQREKFYGKLTIIIENGQIKRALKEESILIS